MMRWLLFLFLWVACAQAQDQPAAGVDFEQKLNATVPLNAEFRDETGAPVRLGHYFGEKPVVLALAYYDCPNLCTLVLNGLLASVRELRFSAPQDFQIVIVSIRPQEAPALAAAKKQTYVGRYARPHGAEGWHFLTGEEPAIRALAESVGFRYRYDAASNQYAHASGVVVLTPGGSVSRYFMGIEYPPEAVRTALVAAGQGKIGTLAERLLLLCFHYNPQSGRYTLAITRALRVGGLVTVLGVGLLIFRLTRQPPPSGPKAVECGSEASALEVAPRPHPAPTNPRAA